MKPFPMFPPYLSQDPHNVADRTAVCPVWMLAEGPVSNDPRGESELAALDSRPLQRTNRIYYLSDDYRRREGTVTNVYERGGVFRFDVLWDDPVSYDPVPWRGTSHGLPVEILSNPYWGIVLRSVDSNGMVERGTRDLFRLGRLVATPAALDALATAGTLPMTYLRCHQTGDWGNLEPADIAENARAVHQRERILSAYLLPTGTPIWIITEADRSMTTVLLPVDY
jgi:hypothetical protein